MIHRDPQRLVDAQLDLIVIGGGVQGICVLLEAARRGLDAALFERHDFGAGTSWNSLKILHGGLRYLQSLDLGRSRESVAAQRWWLDHFPELVEPLPCLLPLYERGLKRRSTMALGLRVYGTLLSPHPSLPRPRLVSVDETLELAPGIRRCGLSGAALWHDALAPSSERLLIELLHWAVGCGAQAYNYVEALPRRGPAGAVDGVKVIDRLDGASFEVGARRVINCAGPDLDSVAGSLSPLAARAAGGSADFDQRSFTPSLAFNLLLDRAPPSSHALAVSGRGDSGGREQTFFLVPLRDRLYAGTCHLPLRGRTESERRVPVAAEVQGFLSLLNSALPDLDASPESVLSVRSGQLPVRRAGTTLLSRRAAIRHSREGLLSVRSVKLTTAPRVAKAVVDQSHPESARSRRSWATDGPHGRSIERPEIVALPSAEQALALPDEQLRELVSGLIEREAVVTLRDVLERRTGWSNEPLECAALRERLRAMARTGRLPDLEKQHNQSEE